MAETEEEPQEEPVKRSKKPFLIGLILALCLGCGGFYATWSGLIPLPGDNPDTVQPKPRTLPDLAFVPIDPVVVSLPPAARSKHLRFTGQLEVSRDAEPDVTLLLPRILDVVNSYLRAVEVARLEDPSALITLRAQMLRRIQLVTGEGRVRDLLITEFVLN
ncbi:MAG: flagellar basal body-associated protein FliL [Pseudorhodobacter sp.]